MAKKSTTASKPARQLGELLQQQQEPFTLQVYLSEKGYGTKNLTSDAKFILSSPKFLNKKGIQHFPKVLKAVLRNMFFTIKGLRTKNPNVEEDGNKQETAEVHRFSSSSCSALYNSSSDSDDIDESSMFTDNSNSSKLYPKRENKAAVDTKFEWGTTCKEEDSEQHSPQSVLEEISTSTDSSHDNISSRGQKSFNLPNLITEESILSATLCNLLLKTSAKDQSSCEGLTDLEQSNASTYSMSKRVLQQTKQLLLDCVRELVDHNNEQGKGRMYLGSEEIGSVICEKIKGWGKQCGDETNIKEMLELDVWMESTQELWNDFEIESQKREMGLLLGNAIVEELTSEVVMDMIGVH